MSAQHDLGAFVEGAMQQQADGADGAAEALAQLERELAETERAVELEGAALQATLDEGVAAVAGQRGAEGAAFVDPFRRAGSLFSGAQHTPSLFVEEAEELGASALDAANLPEGWLRHAAAGPDAPESDRAPIVAELRRRLERLQPTQWARRDALLPLLAPLLPPAELWRACVAWRARSASRPPSGASPPALAEAFVASADIALSALAQDLGLLRSFAADAPLGRSGTQLAHELLGSGAAEQFRAAMEKLRAGAKTAAARGDGAGAATAAAAAVRCFGTLHGLARQGMDLLRAAGLAALDPRSRDTHLAQPAGETEETPRELLMPIPTPSSVKTPSAITFRELTPADDATWLGSWAAHTEAHAGWLSETVRWVLSDLDGDDERAGASSDDGSHPGLPPGLTRLCALAEAVLSPGMGMQGQSWLSPEPLELEWVLPSEVRTAMATAGAGWITRALERWTAQAQPEGAESLGYSLLGDVACACRAVAALGVEGAATRKLLALRAQAAARLAAHHGRLLRTSVLADLDNAQHWLSHRPFLPSKEDGAEARCSYGVLMWRFYTAGVEHDLRRLPRGGLPPAHSTEAMEVPLLVLAPLVLDGLSSVVLRYTRLVFSRARGHQFQTDAFCVLSIAWDMRQRCLRDGADRERLDDLCALLLRCTALLTAPLSAVLEWLASWLAQPGSDGQLPPAPTDDAPDRAAWWSTLPWPLPAHHAQEAADAFDPIAEMGKLTHGGSDGEAWDLTSQPWFRARETMDWSAWLRLGQVALEPEAVLGLLGRRTELREGDYPDLTPEEEALAGALRERLSEAAQRQGGAAEAEPEPEPTKFVRAFSDSDDY